MGSVIFGMGWGLSGLCPGPGAVLMFTKSEGILWVISLSLGQIAQEKFEQKMAVKQSEPNENQPLIASK